MSSWDKAIIAVAVVGVAYMIRQSVKDISGSISNLKFPDLFPNFHMPDISISGGNTLSERISIPPSNRDMLDNMKNAGYPLTTETMWVDEKTGVRVVEAINGNRNYQLPGKWTTPPIGEKQKVLDAVSKQSVLDLPQFYDWDPLKIPIDPFNVTYNQTRRSSTQIDKPPMGSSTGSIKIESIKKVVRVCDSPGRCVSQVVSKKTDPDFAGKPDKALEYWVDTSESLKNIKNIVSGETKNYLPM